MSATSVAGWQGPKGQVQYRMCLFETDGRPLEAVNSSQFGHANRAKTAFWCNLIAAVATLFFGKNELRAAIRALYSQNCHQLANGSRRLIQRRFFFRGELDFDDLLDAARPQFHRHAHKESGNSVLAFEIGRARKNFFLVFEDG